MFFKVQAEKGNEFKVQTEEESSNGEAFEVPNKLTVLFGLSFERETDEVFHLMNIPLQNNVHTFFHHSQCFSRNALMHFFYEILTPK